MSYSGKFKDKNNNLHPVTSVLYGTCDTAAATAAKVVTCSDFDALMTGVTIRVKFANANTAASPTVNINSTGAKSVYRFGSTAPVDGNSWNAGEVVELVYDGTSFFMTGADDIAAKQNATDNSLETEAKTIVGAINEHEGDISSLKSGFTNLDNEVNGDATVYPYADVITIPDAVPANVADCNVKIEPVQDLHGYDKPWVGGAGKQELILTVSDIKTANTAGTWNGNAYTLNGITYTVNTDTDGNVISITVSGTSNSVSTLGFYTSALSGNNVLNGCSSGGGNSSYNITLKKTNNTGEYIGEDSGNGFSFTLSDTTVIYAYIRIASGYEISGALTFYPMIRDASITDDSFAPYTNICPISGHSSVVVTRCGKNMCAEIQQGGYVGNSGELFSNGSYVRTPKMPIKGGRKVTYSYTGDKNTVSTALGWSGDTYIGIIGNNVSATKGLTCEVPTNIDTIAFMSYYSSGITPSEVLTPQVEISENATQYEQYVSCNQYTIALGSTIYGGTVDFDSGVMTVTHGGIILDGTEASKYSLIESGRINYDNADMLYKKFTENREISSSYTVLPQAPTNADFKNLTGYADGVCDFSNASTAGVYTIRIRDDRFTDLQTALNLLAAETPNFVFELATPTTIQLTPQQIQLLKGQNTLTASTGQISVTVNGVSGAIGSLQTQANDTDEALAELVADIADKLPTAPTTDGAYVLTVTVTDGTPTYSWESAT